MPKKVIKKKVIQKGPFIIGVITSDNRVGYYTGNGFDTQRTKAKRYKNRGIASIQAGKFVKEKGVKHLGVYANGDSTRMIHKELKTGANAVKAPRKRRVLKRGTNPIKGSRTRRIKKAAMLYEDFTGHSPSSYDVINVPNYDTCLRVGDCLGIMYRTVRDGKTEHYIHEFKKASQPALCVSHDGRQIFLIGGSYLFKDDGINDI